MTLVFVIFFILFVFICLFVVVGFFCCFFVFFLCFFVCVFCVCFFYSEIMETSSYLIGSSFALIQSIDVPRPLINDLWVLLFQNIQNVNLASVYLLTNFYIKI